MKIIKNQRKLIIDKLMRDSVLHNDQEIDEKVEKTFDDMAKNQQSNLDSFFEKVEENMNQIVSTIDATKNQVKSFEEKVAKKGVQTFIQL